MNCWFLQNKRTISIEIDHKGAWGFAKKRTKVKMRNGGMMSKLEGKGQRLG